MTGLEIGLMVTLVTVYLAGAALMWLYGEESGMWTEVRPVHVPKHVIIGTMMVLWAPLILYSVIWGIGGKLLEMATTALREARADWREGRRQ